MLTTPETSPLAGSPLDLAPVIPVVVVDRASDAVPLARALADGGLPVVEITLRTPAGLDAVRAVVSEVPQVRVGVGTVTTPRDAELAAAAGAHFLVSPGTTPDLLAAMGDTGLRFLPGVATVSEVMALLESGITEMKLFPAEAAGGVALLRSIAGPLPQARFCPTGGITPGSASRYLALPNVGCVGGSWLTPADRIAAGDWGGIRDLAAEAAALGR